MMPMSFSRSRRVMALFLQNAQLRTRRGDLKQMVRRLGLQMVLQIYY